MATRLLARLDDAPDLLRAGARDRDDDLLGLELVHEPRQVVDRTMYTDAVDASTPFHLIVIDVADWKHPRRSALHLAHEHLPGVPGTNHEHTPLLVRRGLDVATVGCAERSARATKPRSTGRYQARWRR